MTVRSITFTGPMIEALLDGRKTQTRRVLNPQPNPQRIAAAECIDGIWCWRNGWDGSLDGRAPVSFETGDLLCVREAYYQRGHWERVEGKRTRTDLQKWAFIPESDLIVFDPPAEFRGGRRHADPHTVAWHKRLGRFMPSKYSRLTLKVTDVRVERVQDISEADAVREGLKECSTGLPDGEGRIWGTPGPQGEFVPELAAYVPREAFRRLWDSINSDRGAGWDANPWVVAISFSVIRQNVDEYLKRVPA